MRQTASKGSAGAADGEVMLARYQRAAAIQAAQADRWFLNAAIEPHWIRGQDQFWYRRETPLGHRFTFFAAPSASRSELFDHGRLAKALGELTGLTLDPDRLPLFGLDVDPGEGVIRFSALGGDWRLDPTGALARSPFGLAGLVVSPDRRWGLFSRDANLWLRDMASGAERELTSDGTPEFAYAAPASVMSRPHAAPRAIWSPDSMRIFTVRTDERAVRAMPLVDYAPGEGARPAAIDARFALPGDPVVTTFWPLIVDVASGRQLAIDLPPLPAARMMVDTPADESRAWWSADGAVVYLLAIDRGEKIVRLIAADSRTGETREIFRETSDTSIELGPDIYAPPAIRFLAGSGQLIWYSERTGWAHLYLYDLATGELIRPLTSGPWLVRQVLGVDEARRAVFLSLAGRSPGKDPYDQEIARVEIDTGELTVLSAGEEDHQVFVAGAGVTSATATLDLAAGVDRVGFCGVSPSGAYFVVKLTTAAGPSRTLLRNRDGRLVGVVEAADASRAPPWWRWPQPVRIKAADGVTDLDALVFRPSDLDPSGSYPVIDVAYGGPQEAVVPRGYGQDFFRDGSYFLDPASLAELGFVTVVIDGRGSAARSRAFRTWSYGALDRASDPADHVAAIRQLAARFPYIDAGRVGITGFSGGGFLAAAAMLRFPDVFQVGVAADGNHDQRLFLHSWGERYGGYPVGDKLSGQANSAHAANLKGRLLLIHGLLDIGVNPAGTFQFAQALIDANRSFDMLVLPRAGHELPGYGARRVWDYFVEHLARATPPTDFPLTSYLDHRRAWLAEMSAPDVR